MTRAWVEWVRFTCGSSVFRRYVAALAICVVTTVLAYPLRDRFEASNIVMLFLLAVLISAWRAGAGPAVLAAFLSVGLFDFFFVPPHFTFAVGDAQYLVTFAVMLCVALVIGQLTAQLREAAEQASARERRAQALYEMARRLSGVVTRTQLTEAVAAFLESNLHVRTALLLAGNDDHLDILPSSGSTLADFSAELARMVYDRGEVTSFDNIMYLPLRAPMRIRGVLAVTPQAGESVHHKTQDPLLITMASLAAIVVERIHYVDVANHALLNVKSEQLRNSLLAALSHDLRTPLTALIGLSDSLALAKPPLSSSQREIAEAIRDQAVRLSNQVHNLLDMARLQAGVVRLRKAWQPFEEVIGTSLQSLDAALRQHVVKVMLPSDLPLMEFDAVLIERVLFNLLDNAAKYTPAASEIVISAQVRGPWLEIIVSDNGPGFNSAATLFEKFARGKPESDRPGVGLGLAICRAIVEAHDGEIRASNRNEGGAAFCFTLPKGEPPAMDAALAERLENDAP